MKKNFGFVVSMACVLSFVSCGSSKQTVPSQYYVAPQSKSDNSNPNGQEIRLSEAQEYALLAPGKRSAGMGISASQSTAQQLAELDARRAFSDAISASITAAAERSGFDITKTSSSETAGESATDGGQQQNVLAKSVSEQIVASTSLVKISKFYNSENKRFTIYVCLEYNGEVAEIAKQAAQKIEQEVKQRVSDEDRVKIQYNLDKFKQEIENELAKQK